MAAAECKHYTRRCSFLTPCCNNIYPCRFCHDADESHELDRTSIEKIICRQCSREQEPATHCVNCGIRFGLYTCLECWLFDDADKQQFHCDKCGLCRVGGVENYFHCDTCDICLQKSLRLSHKCRNESGKDRCPVCFENIHSSSESSFVPKCGHFIHFHCFKLIEKFQHRRCPMCSQPYHEQSQSFFSIYQQLNNDLVNNNEGN